MLKNLIHGGKLEVRKVSHDAGGFRAAPDSPWEYPAEGLTLERGEIHLWRAWLDQPECCVSGFGPVLSQDEIDRAARFHFATGRGRFIAGRAMLRVILSHYVRVQPSQLRFAYGNFGKPWLCYPSGTGIHFNLSHSDGIALFAVSLETAVGVDVERARVVPEADAIVARYFSSREMSDWCSISCAERPQAFLKVWTRKEACLKASGRGLSGLSPRIPVGETGAPRRTSCKMDTFETPPDCVLHDLAPAPGFVGALACVDPCPRPAAGRTH